MKKILLLLLLNVLNAIGQNPSDLDTSFNAIPIPATRHCLDYFASEIETNSVGQMLIRGVNGFNLSYVDANQNLLQSWNYGVGIHGFKFVDDQHALLFFADTSLNGNLVRINLSTGTNDPTFAIDPQVSWNDLAEGSIHIWNNKIYVKANHMQVGGIYKTIIRLNMDGSLDTSFNYNGSSFEKAFYMPDGTVFMYRTNQEPRVTRINTDGSVNSAFTPTSALYFGEVYDIKPAPDGDFYFLGQSWINSLAYGLVKVNPDATLATDFTIPSTSQYQILAMDVQANKIIISGREYQDGNSLPTGFFLKRLLANGTIDNTFANGQLEAQGFIGNNSVLVNVLPDGKFYLSSISQFRYDGILIKKLIRFNSNGSRDYSFDKACKGFVDGKISAVAEQPDGKLLVSGEFNSYDGVETPAKLIRLFPDGTIDNAFQVNLGRFIYTGPTNISPTDSFSAIQVMPDGKILLAGIFTYQSLDGTTSRTLLVLNPDGTTFKSYNEPVTYSGQFQIRLQSTGRPLIFSNETDLFAPTLYSNMIRLDENYNADITFQPIGVSPTEIRKFVVLPDDKILINGLYQFGSQFRRYNANGSLDSSFSSTVVSYNFEMQTDGKIIIFTDAPTGSSFFFAFKRLNAAGAVEAVLWQTSMLNSNFLLQPDNKIIYVNPNDLITRYNPTGTIDTSFEQKLFENSNYAPDVMKILSDGRIIIGGSDDIYDGQRIGKLAVLKGDQAQMNLNELHSGKSISIYPNPVKETFTIQSADLISNITLYDCQGRQVETQLVNGQTLVFDLSKRPSGLYFVKVETINGIEIVKLVKE
ncbi:MAG: T9SS type A sorting domain-containing protein [Sphingobacteriales bacterium]|nr:MAG: T9SS type A sorting domain-containing protein [Sphingobacteriales bacterium]